VGYWGRALTEGEIGAISSGVEPILPPPNPALASNPIPEHKATDVPRDIILKWTPGAFAPPVNGHRVYFSENFDDVNNGAPAANRGITSAAEFDTTALPFLLDFDTTYYWRIDEVNTITGWDEGNVWQFTTELLAYPIDGSNITATASSAHQPTTGPENTINGSGLDPNGLLHSTESADMWLSSTTGPQPTWIQYEFNKAYKLREMWVWNYNVEFEFVLGLGLKDVTIEYSVNGTDWDVLPGVPQFAQGTGQPDYEHNTTVNFDGVVAKYVKITANSNWGTTNQYGLSEVRFYYIPVWAREPSPHRATDIGPDAVLLNWRAGREAATHKLYFSTDRQAVTAGTVVPVSIPFTRTQSSYDAGALELGTTYYWKINEVNMAEEPNTWEGDVWHFATPEDYGVDDFEDYNDHSNRIFYTWRGGYGFTGNCGNGTGAIIGNPQTPFAEPNIVHEGAQSMPYFYDNTRTGINICGQPINVTYSEAGANTTGPNSLDVITNWTKYGIRALSLWFYGDQDNEVVATDRMYMVLEDSLGREAVVQYDGNVDDIKKEQWQEWNIDLSDFVGPVDLSNVKKVSIGFGVRGSSTTYGGKGKVYFDDLRLYPCRCVPSRAKPAADLNNDCMVNYADLEILTNNWLISTYQVQPQNPGTGNQVGHWPFSEGSGLTTADVAPAGHGNHGTLVDGPQWTAGPPGQGYAISFDGIDDYVVCAERSGSEPGLYPAELMPSTFTVSCWAKLDNFTYYSALVGNGIDTGTDECGFFLYNSGGESVPNFGLAIRTESGMYYVETPGIYETDTWYHLAATYDGTTAKVYVDGGLAGGPTDVGGPIRWVSAVSGNYPERFAIGVWLDPGYELWVDGTIDDVQFYNTALSQGQVGWLAGKQTPYTQPLYLLLTPPDPAINMYDGDVIPTIDLKDFTAMAEMWVYQLLWPQE